MRVTHAISRNVVFCPAYGTVSDRHFSTDRRTIEMMLKMYLRAKRIDGAPF